jgi:hypothetical protein
MKARIVLGVLLALCAARGHAAEPLEALAESGPVSARVRVSPAEPVIGDPILLELEVRAEPDVEILMPEFGEALDRFAIVAFAPSEEVDEAGFTIARQRYTLQPSRSGPLGIPPLLVEFVDRREGRAAAPEGEDAYELLTERIELDVSTVLPADAPLDPRPALGALGPRAAPGGPVWPWLLVIGLALLAASPFAARAMLAARAQRRRRSAYDVARGELDALLYGPRPDADGDAMDLFFVRLSGIVRCYLEDRFGLRSPELTTEEFLEQLSTSPDLVRSHQTLLRGFLERADLVKFAHHVPDAAAVEESIQTAHRFLEETREGARA